MNLFKGKKSKKSDNQSALAEMALNAIHDGVVITNKSGAVEFINPAGATMTGYSRENAIGLDYGLVIKLESKEGRELMTAENPLIQAMTSGQPLEAFHGSLIVGQSDKRIPVSVSVLPTENMSQKRIITFRDITKELEEEGEQTEFISTASHEMRTPIAAIDGYLSLCLNPQTATIDERAKGYLEASQVASKHLGKLFQDLLDATKLDDNRIKPRFTPEEMVSLVEGITKDYSERAKSQKIALTFGSNKDISFDETRKLSQVVYSFIDKNFIREILDNLIDNALKYTPAGGSIYVNVRGDGDRVLINVTDTGIGISSDDLAHIFQKFYRADNSDTRTVGGTGLGLYLVKQRAEAMGGKVWAESAFGEGSTFFVSLPRLSDDEYEKRMITVRNQEIQEQIKNSDAIASATTSTVAPINPFQTTQSPSVPVTTPQLTSTPITSATPQVAPPPQPITSANSSIPSPTVKPAVPPPAPLNSPAPPIPAPGTSTVPSSVPPQPIQKTTNNNLNGDIK
ncbi:PAS domain-containing protein [Candidatus Saccharibacteria bacterium]|nr:PAS domain-containing protein [Candidatus Saccharibacteria bacterium]